MTLCFENHIQIMTGKTIIASSNTTTDISAAIGDILWHNGTKFTRLVRGAAGHYLKTNSTSTDIALETETLTVYLDDLADVVKQQPFETKC
jgi:hypothetical protein